VKKLLCALAWIIYPVVGLQAAEAPFFIEPRYGAEEAALIQSLRIDHLDAPPSDTSNRVADDPRAAALGRKLFFDPRLSRNGKVACASCHRPEHGFSDPLKKSRGIGETTLNSMTLAGGAWQNWFFWDGRKDSLWSQALAPLEAANEHGLDRVAAVHKLAHDYRADYELLFGKLPNIKSLPPHASPLGNARERRAWNSMPASERTNVSRAFANLGKSIAAWERTLRLAPNRFDRYAEALAHDDKTTMRASLTPDEVAGMRLFIGPARCIQCHNGPLFSNGEFHNTGVRFSDRPEDAGRTHSVETVRRDEFNCLGRYSDAAPNACAALRFLPMQWPGKLGGFKVPILRNISHTAPYMRTGEFATLRAVLDHYNPGSHLPYASERTEIVPLKLSSREMDQIAAFLATLDSIVIEHQSLQKSPVGSR
jgi:cytochrome c peroxidase